MNINSLKSKSVHIVGINGIGMSALAIYLKNKGIVEEKLNNLNFYFT